MIWLAVIVEAAIGNWVDMIILLFIQFVNAGIGWCAPALASYQTSSQAAMILAQIWCKALTFGSRIRDTLQHALAYQQCTLLTHAQAVFSVALA
jgi:hypothetical protein